MSEVTLQVSDSRDLICAPKKAKLLVRAPSLLLRTPFCFHSSLLLLPLPVPTTRTAQPY